VTFYTKEDIPYVKNIANIIAASEKQAGKPASEASMQKWLLDALPKPSKEEKKKLKMYGVEARRGGWVLGRRGKRLRARRAGCRLVPRADMSGSWRIIGKARFWEAGDGFVKLRKKRMMSSLLSRITSGVALMSRSLELRLSGKRLWTMLDTKNRAHPRAVGSCAPFWYIIFHPRSDYPYELSLQINLGLSCGCYLQARKNTRSLREAVDVIYQ
jgi:hypothetical protein